MKPTRGQIITSILCLIPAGLILAARFCGTLSANPIQDMTLRTGRTAVLLLIASLFCTPLKNLFGLTALIQMRKTIGLFAFFYALAHFLIFAGLDYEFNLGWIGAELQTKPFLLIGLAALILLLPLAVTSLRKLRIKMGRRWALLHRLVYVIMGLVLLHFFQASKGDFQIPLLYTVIFTGLMLLRIPPLSKISISKKPRWLRDFNQFLLG
jgi:sulfoxide reductase heme-binding subunit YedZ